MSPCFLEFSRKACIGGTYFSFTRFITVVVASLQLEKSELLAGINF